MNSLIVLFVCAWFLLGIGAYGLVTASGFLRVMIALQLMVKGAIIMLVVAGHLTGQYALGQSLAITVITVDTLVMVIGLALVVQVKTHKGTLNMDEVINVEG